MNKTNYALIALFFMALSAFGQKKKDILLTIDGKPVLKKEFKQVYKKNLDLVQDEKQKTVDGYLEMFVDYKLKVTEAYHQKFNEDPTYKKEFAQYEEQLSRNYIFENKVTQDLAKEGYERGLEEIKASHILVLTSYADVPTDTLKAYQKIQKIRESAVAGEDFAKLAKENSEEPNANRTAGDLGYFTAFNFVYPFETMAYNTPVGEISEIVRTQYGYHIIKIHDRRTKEGDVEVSHIMLATQKGKLVGDPKQRIKEIQGLLEQGESFESLARKYSDDKNSAKNGGKIRRFSKGQLRSVKFEEAAFALKNPGEVSNVVTSEFGVHLIRLDKKHPLATYEEKKEELERKVKDGTRSKIVTSAVNEKIKERYGFEKKGAFLPYFENFIPDSILKSTWKYLPVPQKDNKPLFVIGDRELGYSDLASFIGDNQKKQRGEKSKTNFLLQKYDEFETFQLKKYFRDQLENENEEYALVINEYRDGLLIFSVMGENVWEKAKSDTTGQQSFFNKNRGNYQWKKRVVLELLSTSKKDRAEMARKLLLEGKAGNDVKRELNKDQVNIIFTKQTYEINHPKLPKNFEAKMGVSEIYEDEDSFIIANVTEIIPAGNKEFSEIKGKVLSDFQNEVEKKWMEELRAKYKVEVNKKALKKLKKELNQ